jgi:predicted acyl esterase
MRSLVLLSLLPLLAAQAVVEKHEMLPMRDGTRLSVYLNRPDAPALGPYATSSVTP